MPPHDPTTAKHTILLTRPRRLDVNKIGGAKFTYPAARDFVPGIFEDRPNWIQRESTIEIGQRAVQAAFLIAPQTGIEAKIRLPPAYFPRVFFFGLREYLSRRAARYASIRPARF